MNPSTPPRKRTAVYWLRLIAFFIIVLYLAVVIAFATYSGNQQIRPAHSRVCCETPADYGLEFENVSFRTHDGLTLRGWLIPSRNGAVIITLHGYGGNRLGTLLQARLLAKHGYGVLLYDQRATGESDGENLSWGWRDVPDVSNAIRYLQAQKGADPARVGVYGCSTGAEIALAAGALETHLQAVAAEDAEFTAIRDTLDMPTLQDKLSWPLYPVFITVMEWRSGTSATISLSEAAGRIAPRPLLLISNGRDFDYSQAQHYIGLAKEPKEHWNIPDSFHCGGLATHPQDYEQELAGFFDTALLKK